MAEYSKNFPSQIASDLEKESFEYGLKVARAIENAWFNGDSYSKRYNTYQNQFHQRRLHKEQIVLLF